MEFPPILKEAKKLLVSCSVCNNTLGLRGRKFADKSLLLSHMNWHRKQGHIQNQAQVDKE